EEPNLNEIKRELDEFLFPLKEKISTLAKILLEKEKIEYNDVKEVVQV
ncbi:hypothetical protein PIR71_001744, partial [Campylobacter coli]|nr:hypothetical protein [Campylobacter coli]